MTANFAEPPLVLTPEQLVRFVGHLPQLQLIGGAVYDALIAAGARQAGAALLTLDVRAARTYLTVGADAKVL